uniref:Ribosomal protein S14 n=1 Tax=Psammoneis japonica TaxID=517775 RepID=A0A2U9GIQ1_9STRA|nr:ribosomal protein S14 [Psammoneis japonica]AWQ64238.1 ribosomal protein S14 [Psammoneis japonica]
MKKLLQKDKNNRLIVKKFEIQRIILKSIILNLNYSQMIRWKAILMLTNLPALSSEIRIINRCIVTGNKKRVNKLYNYSRMVFLKLIRSGYISGIKKSSW